MIELLVVVAIIGILVALAFPVISQVRESAKKAAARADMSSLETSLEQYVAEYRRMPIADVFHTNTKRNQQVSWRGMTEWVTPERFAVPGGAWHHDAQEYTDTDSGRIAICAIASLQGSNEFEGSPTGFNPREEQFLQIQEGRPIGHFMDPWSKGFDLGADPLNRMYSLLFDHNMNKLIDLAALSRVIPGYLIEGKRIVIQCYGPNRVVETRVDADNRDDLYNIDIDAILERHGKL